MIRPGEVWLDTNGKVIQAHGGCLLRADGLYYWYGEDKSGPTNGRRVDVVGIHVYSSSDLTHWTDCGLALSAVNEPGHDLHPCGVVERPKVLYNEKTGKYVMWMHIDDRTYRKASVGVAVSDTPGGPFEYIRSFRPCGVESRDMTLFQDADGSAYVVYSSDQNRTTRIAQLTEDYLACNGSQIAVFVDQQREAPALIRHDDKYYMLGSGCTGWDPNPSLYAVSNHIFGHWRLIDNPFEGEGKETSFESQSTWLMDLPDGRTMYMGDRWRPGNLSDSRYIWLPIEWENGRMKIVWKEEWAISG